MFATRTIRTGSRLPDKAEGGILHPSSGVQPVRTGDEYYRRRQARYQEAEGAFRSPLPELQLRRRAGGEVVRALRHAFI